MLLRSISKHVKVQNWFAVVLDFLIVVAGILIAFPITEWNEANASAAGLISSLERLDRELVLNLDIGNAILEKFDRGRGILSLGETP